MSALASCVFEHESTDDWTINTGNGFMGGFQFEPSTWDEATADMGEDWPLSSDPQDPLAGSVVATPAEQVAVFDYWEPGHRLAWPVTVPECGG
jgi:hypothetical protein